MTEMRPFEAPRARPQRRLAIALLLATLSLSMAPSVACDQLIGLPENAAVDPNIDCQDGECQCKRGFADCDKDVGTGCEIDIDTSDENCGACGLSCRGGRCEEGLCTPREVTSAFGFDIALQGDRLIFCGYLPFLLVPLAGGAFMTTNFNQPGWPCASVYAEGDLAYGIVHRDIDGAPNTQLIQIPPATEPLKSTLVGSDLSGTTFLAGLTSKYVVTTSTTQGSRLCRTDRAASPEAASCIDTKKSPPLPATTTESGVYFATKQGISLLRDDADVPEPVTLPPEIGPVLGMALRGERMFLLDACPLEQPCRRVWASLSAGEAPHLLAALPVSSEAPIALPMTIAVDDQSVFVTDGTTEGALWRVAIRPDTDPSPLRIASAIHAANWRLLRRDGALYWNDGSGAYRLVLPPP